MVCDLRFSLRLLLKSPGFTLAAVLTLALGIGPTAAVFSLTDALGLRPLPVERPDDLVAVFTGTAESPDGQSSYPDYLDLAAGITPLEGLAAYGGRGVALTGLGDLPAVAILQVVSPNFFDVLGVRASQGRLFSPSDATSPGWPEVAVVSESLWRRRLGGRLDAIGGAIELNGRAFMLAGVAPASFRGLEALFAPDVWIPADGWPFVQHGNRAEIDTRGRRWFSLIGRISRGRDLAAARSEAAVVGRRLAAAYPESNRDRIVTAMPESRARGRGIAFVRRLLLAGVGLVVLIGCTNVAGLLLARADARRRELAVRAALGGDRVRLLRLLLFESVLIAAGATLAGLAFGYWMIGALPALVPPTPIPLNVTPTLDGRVVGFTIAASLVTVLVFGLPAVSASRPALAPLIKGDSAAEPRRRVSTRDVLVVGQIALTLVLLVAAGLFVRGLRNSQRVDPGFDEGPMLLLTLAPGIGELDAAELVEYQHALVERVAAVAGVDRVSLARRMPLSPFGGGARQAVDLPGRTPPEGEDAFSIRFNTVAPGYFRTLGTRIVRGRDFETADRPNGPKVAIVSETMARRFWPDGGALGQTIGVGRPASWHTVVGVAADAKINSLVEEPEPYLYLSTDQHPLGELTLLVRPAQDEALIAGVVRRAVAAIDPRVPALQMLTMNDHLRFAMFEPRVIGILSACLGFVGLALAIVGLYAVTAYAVGRRRREFGVRLALGASPRRLVLGVLARGLVLGGVGLAVGLGLALAGGPAAAGVLYGVSPRDPIALAGASAVLLAATLVATWLPARRAARVDPAVTLKAEP